MYTCELPTKHGIFKMLDTNDESTRMIFLGNIKNNNKIPIVRIHSSCIASEVFGALDCDCADQLEHTMKLIAKEKYGIIIHLHQEGRGHGLSRKIKAVGTMQTQNVDTAESFDILGYEYDVREYKSATDLLKELNINKIRIVTNNPRKIAYVKSQGIDIVENINTISEIRKENKEYLYSKNEKLDHFIPLP
ncbi:GTP cyclohydrolase II RibA [Prolixibacteraceae bacterium]|nr:GTP cyclohydrolase II RibA [Prolixibacteraceae bacterium]